MSQGCKLSLHSYISIRLIWSLYTTRFNKLVYQVEWYKFMLLWFHDLPISVIYKQYRVSDQFELLDSFYNSQLVSIWNTSTVKIQLFARFNVLWFSLLFKNQEVELHKHLGLLEYSFVTKYIDNMFLYFSNFSSNIFLFSVICNFEVFMCRGFLQYLNYFNLYLHSKISKTICGFSKEKWMCFYFNKSLINCIFSWHI